MEYLIQKKKIKKDITLHNMIDEKYPAVETEGILLCYYDKKKKLRVKHSQITNRMMTR